MVKSDPSTAPRALQEAQREEKTRGASLEMTAEGKVPARDRRSARRRDGDSFAEF
jgi:hypothetical protein